MTLKKAIEILHDYKMQSAFEATPDFKDALKLGIQALKHITAVRILSLAENPPLLPGETEE